MKLINQVLEFLGLATLVSFSTFALIKYFSKQIFENYLQKRLESHKSELEKLNISHQIQFSSLHAQRAQIIKNLYDYLYDYKTSVLSFFDEELDLNNPEENLKFKLQQWTNAVLNFNNAYHKNKIFFSFSDSKLINEIHNEMSKINYHTQNFLMSYKYVQEQINAINNQTPEYIKLQDESDVLIDKIFKLEGILENQFRLLLGVELKN